MKELNTILRCQLRQIDLFSRIWLHISQSSRLVSSLIIFHFPVKKSYTFVQVQKACITHNGYSLKNIVVYQLYVVNTAINYIQSYFIA